MGVGHPCHNIEHRATALSVLGAPSPSLDQHTPLESVGEWLVGGLGGTHDSISRFLNALQRLQQCVRSRWRCDRSPDGTLWAEQNDERECGFPQISRN